MKTRRTLSTKTTPRLRQKQTFIYTAAGIALAACIGVGIFFYLNIGNSEDTLAAAPDFYSFDNKTSNWTNAASWVGGVAPATANIDKNIEIFGYITRSGSLTYKDGSKKTLTVTDTLVVEGNLHMGNDSDVIVRAGGVLVVTGNFSATNKIEVSNGGVFVVGGNMVFSPSSQDTYNGSTGSLYVGGSTIGNSTASGNNRGMSALQSEHPAIASFMSGSTSTLPIKLAYFRAKMQAKDVLTEWATDEEVNNDFFSIERSTDGQHFEVLATVAGAGSSHHFLTYQWTDTKPLPGLAYYRLKQTDFDGKFDYSNIVAVTMPQAEESKPSFSASPEVHAVFPNPFEDAFTIDFTLTEDSPVEIRLLNMQGAVVASQTSSGFSGSNQHIFVIEKRLPSGPYLLSMVCGSASSKTVRILKK